MLEPKRSFASALPEIVQKFGTKVRRSEIQKFCYDHNISLSHILRHHRVERGLIDLSPLIEKGSRFSVVREPSAVEPEEQVPERTEAEILDDIAARFSTLDIMAEGIIERDYRAMIVAGNPGIGKTYSLESIMEKAANESKILFTSVRGYVRATGLFRLLWQHRDENAVVMFDDADSIFNEETGLNILKTALDTTRKREISWRSEKVFEQDGENIPPSFQFNGAVIFVSNLDFERLVARQNALAPHLEALMSRSYYLDLNMRSVKEMVVHIKHIIDTTTILTDIGIRKKDDMKRIAKYVDDNQNNLREISLRTVVKLGKILKASRGNEDKFIKVANGTVLKRVYAA